MSLFVVSSAEHLVACPTGIGLPRHRWILQVGLHMPGQVGLLCKFLVASLAGEHGHGLSQRQNANDDSLTSILFGSERITNHPSSDWFNSYNLIG